ncbi:MAG: DsbA family protein [Chloroflexi bacterium]|nr:MAG: DsbA family protein [Chloroflexota bacterium]
MSKKKSKRKTAKSTLPTEQIGKHAAEKRQRRKEKERARKRKSQLTTLLGFAGVVAVIAVIIITAGANSAPTVAQERLDLDPVRGNPDAPVTIIEYGAFACPSCRQLHQSGLIEQLLEQYDGQVKFVFRDFPVIVPQYDRMAAQLAQCALDQGNDAFWHFHDALYEQVNGGYGISQDDLIALGGQLGLDTAELRACAEENRHAQTVSYDEQRARRLGLRGTPSLFINDQPVYSFRLDTLQQLIDEALGT